METAGVGSARPIVPNHFRPRQAFLENGGRRKRAADFLKTGSDMDDFFKL
jgi:hypothetical protein